MIVGLVVGFLQDCALTLVSHFVKMNMFVLNLSTFYLLIYCNVLTHGEKFRGFIVIVLYIYIHTYIYRVLLLFIFSSLYCSSLVLWSSLRYSTFCLYLLICFFISALLQNTHSAYLSVSGFFSHNVLSFICFPIYLNKFLLID